MGEPYRVSGSVMRIRVSPAVKRAVKCPSTCREIAQHTLRHTLRRTLRPHPYSDTLNPTRLTDLNVKLWTDLEDMFDLSSLGILGNMFAELGAFMCLYIGSRLLRYRPRLDAGGWLGIAGAILFALSLLIPIEIGYDESKVPLLAVLELLGHKEAMFVGGSALARIVLFSVALCFLIMSRATERSNVVKRSRAGASAFIYLWLSVIVPILAIFLMGLIMGGMEISGDDLVNFLGTAAKLVPMVLGMLLIMPMAICDLAIELTPEPAPEDGPRTAGVVASPGSRQW
jgi:hypothetical protein